MNMGIIKAAMVTLVIVKPQVSVAFSCVIVHQHPICVPIVIMYDTCIISFMVLLSLILLEVVDLSIVELSHFAERITNQTIIS